jgi:serine O-acetyltransferase
MEEIGMSVSDSANEQPAAGVVRKSCERGKEVGGLLSTLRSDIDCVFGRDPAARNRLEVVITYPGLHALIWHRLAHAMWRRRWRFPARFVAYISRMLTNIDIHPGATIGQRFFIDHGAGVVIGETAEIGDDCTLYHGVTLGGTSWSRGKRHPTLASGVMVGAGAKVLGPIRLGEGARVGANSVVGRDVPANRTVVGIPAKVVRLPRRQAVGHDRIRIDLDHHLMPDPAGRAIACLIDRIEYLEQQLQPQVDSRRGRRGEHSCGECCACNETADEQKNRIGYHLEDCSDEQS